MCFKVSETNDFFITAKEALTAISLIQSWLDLWGIFTVESSCSGFPSPPQRSLLYCGGSHDRTLNVIESGSSRNQISLCTLHYHYVWLILPQIDPRIITYDRPLFHRNFRDLSIHYEQIKFNVRMRRKTKKPGRMILFLVSLMMMARKSIEPISLLFSDCLQ